MSDEIVLGRILPLIFLLIGIGLLLGATRYFLCTRAFLAGAIETTGEVVAMDEEPPTEAGEFATYRPVVSFSISPTQRIQFQSMAHSNPPEYKVGASVRVLYHPNQPNDARIRSFTTFGCWRSFLAA